MVRSELEIRNLMAEKVVIHQTLVAEIDCLSDAGLVSAILQDAFNKVNNQFFALRWALGEEIGGFPK